MRRADQAKPIFPWPSPPAGIFEANHQTGRTIAVNIQSVHLVVLLIGIGFLFGAIVLLSGGNSTMGSLFLVSAGAAIALPILNVVSRLEWDESGLTLSKYPLGRKKYTWDQIQNVTYKRKTVDYESSISAFLSLRPECLDPREIRIEFSDGEWFEFRPSTKNDLSLAIAIGSHFKDNEETELAKPINVQMYSPEAIKKFKIKYVSSVVVGTLLLPGVAYLVFFKALSRTSLPIVCVVLAFGALKGLREYLKRLETYKTNPAFTDPDRPIELLMYDQYGDLAEPLGRFYRHVWANDAKRTQRQPTKTDL